MIQKSSYQKTLETFFQEPTGIHFIREIGRKIGLAQTSVRNNIRLLEKDGMIMRRESKPFDGFSANRDSEEFVFHKRIYNLSSLYNLNKELVSTLYPRSIVLFGSYSRGEDTEDSDIDILIVSKARKRFDLSKHEKELKRKINIMIVEKINDLDDVIINKVYNGIILYGAV